MRRSALVAVILLFCSTVFAQAQTIVIAHKKMLVGGVRQGKWLKDVEVAKSLAKPLKFVGFDSFTGAKPAPMFGTSEAAGCGATFFYFDETPKLPADVFAETSLDPAIALGGNVDWNPLPRRPARLDANEPALRRIATGFLKSKGIVVRSLKLENAVSIDLDGDGKDELFLEATNYVDRNGDLASTARKGGFSFVMMRRTAGGRSRDVLVAGEFHPRKPTTEDYVSEVEISQFADLNGDGRLEVVLETLYSYAGASSEIYELGKSGLRSVLAVECGD